MTSLRSKDISLPIIGKPTEALSTLRLPTNQDVLRRFTYSLKVQKVKRSIAVQVTCAEVMTLWQKIAGKATAGRAYYLSMPTIKKKLNKYVFNIIYRNRKN